MADFIGESNIIDGVMRADGVVEIFNRRFQCLDKGFGKDEPVDVVIRPEDVDIVDEAAGQLRGTVTSVTFKGVHYDTNGSSRPPTSAPWTAASASRSIRTAST